MQGRFLNAIVGSTLFKVVTTLLTYALYSVILGLSLAAPVGVALYAITRVWHGLDVVSVIGCAMAAAAAFFLWLICAAFVFAIFVRLFSLGLKPGRYPAVSLTTLQWIIASGIYVTATRTFMPFIVMSPFLLMFFKVCGCRIGRNVWLNTYHLNDCYFMEIGDDVVLGGNAILSAHTYENGQLVLAPIRIGKGALIGADSYVGPGTTIGEHAVVGMFAHVKKNSVIPPHATFQEVGSMPAREVVRVLRIGRSTGTAGA